MSNNMSSAPLQALVKVEQHNIALIFVDYLQSIAIKAEVRTIDNYFVVFCDADHFERSRAEFEHFIQQPHNEKYQQAAWQHGQVSDVQQHSQSVKQQFLAHTGITTLVIFSLCWLVFIASITGWESTIFNALQFYPDFTFHNFLQQPLRILGPALFHFSWFHIIFNTMWWWQLGCSIEQKLGWSSLLIIFVVSAIISNAGQYLVSGPNFGGLSGVVYALFGYVWWLQWLAPKLGLNIPKPLIGMVLVWMLLGFAEVLPENMANTAHLLGLVSGCILAWLKAQHLKRQCASIK